MKKPELLGKYVYLDIPSRKELKIEVDANTKESLEKEFLNKLQRIQIWKVGDAANPKLKEGQWVLVDPETLSRKAKLVPFPDGKKRALVLDYDIIHIWPDDE